MLSIEVCMNACRVPPRPFVVRPLGGRFRGVSFAVSGSPCLLHCLVDFCSPGDVSSSRLAAARGLAFAWSYQHQPSDATLLARRYCRPIQLLRPFRVCLAYWVLIGSALRILLIFKAMVCRSFPSVLHLGVLPCPDLACRRSTLGPSRHQLRDYATRESR